MASLKEVRNRITSIKSTQQITKAMKMVAAAKLKRAQDRIIEMRPYAEKLGEILGNLSSSASVSENNPFFEQREPNKVLIIAVTSDRGLCGAFNTNIFKSVNSLLLEKYTEQVKKGDVSVLPVGKKSLEYFGKKGLPVLDSWSDLFKSLRFDDAKEAVESVMENFTNGTYDRVELVYNEFKNAASQIIRKEQLLPILELPSVEEVKTASTDYIFEPSQEYIINELIPSSLKIRFFKALLESNAAEHGARMTAMDKATENAGDLLRDLRLMYNRTRQAAITTEILEIVGGAEALSEAS